MVSRTYDKYRIIDEDYLEEHINEILSLNTYIPYILTGIMREIYVDPKLYSKWKNSINRQNNEKLARCYIKQKSLHQSFAFANIPGKKGTASLSILLEFIIFLEIHPEFYGIIKDENYLDEIIDQFEKEFNIDILDYTNNYDDLERLLKEIKE